MIKLEKMEVTGWEHAIRGMRNPMNSWNKSDSDFVDVFDDYVDSQSYHLKSVNIGENDLELMSGLAKNGSVHAKYRRMITVYVDITAPFYWWKEFDTYKVGTVVNSCSTMHKIHEKEFTLDDFSHEHLLQTNNGWIESNNSGKVLEPLTALESYLEVLNVCRNLYLQTKDKKYWWQMIQLLPSSYNQRRTVMLNYEVLANIYKHRRNHKLDEWREFCKWIDGLPYSKIITINKYQQAALRTESGMVKTYPRILNGLIVLNEEAGELVRK